MGRVASEHVSLAVVMTTAVLTSVKHGDHDVKLDGCDVESAASMMSFKRLFNAV
jgi:hypothetical protein